MSAHTKGPWTHGHFGTDALWIGVSHETLPVAMVEWDTDNSHPNARENARLLAAAPALLEFAELVAAHFVNTKLPLGIKAREVIAKATQA